LWRSIAQFLEQLHNLTPPGAYVFHVLIDGLQFTSQRFDHRRPRRKIGRRLGEAGANFTQRKTQSLGVID